jgi:hypothetical protein
MQGRNEAKVPWEVRMLTCGSWKGGRADYETQASWNLDFGNLPEEINKDTSAGSRITSTEETSILLDEVVPTRVVTPSSPPASSIRSSGNIALEETPPDRRSTIRKAPDDCHVILR